MSCTNCGKITAVRGGTTMKRIELNGVGKPLVQTLSGVIAAAWCDKIGAQVRFIGKSVLYDAPVGSKVFVDLLIAG